jgi:hypothetical protein
VTSLACPVIRPRTDGDGRPAGGALPAGSPPYAKGPACRARGATLPCLVPAPEGTHTHTDPRRHGPGPARSRTIPAPPRPALPAGRPGGGPAGPWPARWEVVLRLRASAVLPGWSSGKVNSNLACPGIPQPPRTASLGAPTGRGRPSFPLLPGCAARLRSGRG